MKHVTTRYCDKTLLQIFCTAFLCINIFLKLGLKFCAYYIIIHIVFEKDNVSFCFGEWKMFPIPTKELLLSLQGNILLKNFPLLLGNFSGFYWEKFCPPTVGNVSHPYWEMFPIPTGKCFPSILGNISLPAGKLFPSLLGLPN